MRQGTQFHRLRVGLSPATLPVMGLVQAHDLGQDVRIAGVGLRAEGGVPPAGTGLPDIGLIA